MPDDAFDPEVVAAIARHMNDDHADDSVLMCRVFGGRTDAERATMVGLDAEGADFTVEVAGGEQVEVRVPFGAPVGDRTEVRGEIVRLAVAARAASGVPAPDHG